MALRALLLPETCWIHVEVSLHLEDSEAAEASMFITAAHQPLWKLSWFLLLFCHSGPMRAYVLAREDAIRHWRDLMGPTKVFRARHTCPASIRAQFGLTDTRNTTHGSGRNPLSVLMSTQIIITVRSQLISAAHQWRQNWGRECPQTRIKNNFTVFFFSIEAHLIKYGFKILNDHWAEVVGLLKKKI